MTIQNFKFTTPEGNIYIIDGVIEHFNNSGFGFTKLLKINDKEEDNIVLRSLIKHEDILNYYKQLNNIQC